MEMMIMIMTLIYDMIIMIIKVTPTFVWFLLPNF